jgi:hypothetical protein
MFARLGSISLALSLLLAACASPSDVGNARPPGTAEGPGPDLGGFVVQDPPDFASGGITDLSFTPWDLGGGPTGDMAQSGSASCGAITYAGQCTGSTLTYCNASNSLQTIDCAPSGRQCTVVAGDSDCRYVAGSPCGSLDSAGTCDGDTAVWCEASKVVTKDCAALGSICFNFIVADCL